MVPAGSEYSTEMVSPKLYYWRNGKAAGSGAVSQASWGEGKCILRAACACGRFEPYSRSLKNALTIMYSKEDILFKALKVRDIKGTGVLPEGTPHCAGEIRRMPNNTISMEKLKRVWYEGRDGSNSHYDSTRYYALNLHAVFSKELWSGDVLRVPSMQEKCGQISLWLLPSPPKQSIRNAPRCGKRRSQRIRHLPSVLFCGWGSLDRNIRMSGNICLPIWRVTEHGDMTAVPMNV